MLKVSPTRASLLMLKKKLKTAERGFKLLKDKRDGLMKKFMSAVREAASLRSALESRLESAFASFARGSITMSENALESAFLAPAAGVSLEVKVNTVMSVKVPSFQIHKNGSGVPYGFLETSGDLDRSVMKFDEVFPDLIRLAELEKQIERMAEEIERTRRRVSALENTLIPKLKTTVRFITQRLEEQARDAVVSTMRVKAMIEAKGR